MKYRYRTDDEMKDSGVEWLGKIPKEWEVLHLRKILKGQIVDGPHETPEYVEEGIPFISVDSLSESENVNIDIVKKFISKEKYHEYNKKTDLKKNDILFSKSATIGKVAIVDERIFMTWSPLAILKVNNEKSYFKNLFYILKSNRYVDYIKSLSSLNTQLNIGMKVMEKSKIAVSKNIIEQQKIASFLDKKTAEFDSIIEKKERIIEKMEEAKKSLISEVVTGKVKIVDGEIVPRDKSEIKGSGVEWLGKIPKDWEVKKLRYLGFTKNGISAGSEYFGSGYPFVSYSDVYNSIELPQQVKGLAKSTIEDQKNYSIEEGDVLFTRTSETIEEVGFASTCMRTIEKSTFAGFLIRFRPIKNKLLKGFSKYYFSSSIHRSYFVKNMNLVTRASLSQDLLKGLYVMLPNLQEQQKIADFLDEKTAKIDSTIEKINLQIEKLKEAKQSLISEAVTGKIEVME